MGSGIFIVAEYFDAGTLFPQERGDIYEASPFKGPFNTVSEFHSVLLSLNHDYALVDTEDENGEFLLSVGQCRLAEPKISLPQYESGPFVINHDDLSSSNILVRFARLPGFYILTCPRQVDDNYNITGLLDFSGTIVPLPSLCDDPIMLTENFASPFTDRNLWVQSILDAEPVPGSALNDLEVRKLILKKSFGRSLFDLALRHTYAYIVVQEIFEGDAEDKADDIHKDC